MGWTSLLGSLTFCRGKELKMKKLQFTLGFGLALILIFWTLTVSHVCAYRFQAVETLLTTDQSDQFDPSISGSITVYSDRRNADADIYYYDIENYQEVRVTVGGGDQLLNDVSGNLIVYTDYGSGNADIYVYNIETDEHQQVTSHLSNQRRPAISGHLIVYEDDRNGNYDIYLYDLSSGLETQLTNDPSHQRKPAINAQIVVWEDFRKGNADVYMLDLSADLPIEIPVTDDPAQDVDPDVDGNIIVFGSNRDSIGDIFLYRIEDGVTMAITNGDAYERNPAVSGDYVAYESYAAGDSDIWLYSISLGVSERATIDPEEQYLHDISSNRVVYTDNRNNDPEGDYQLDIYMMEFNFVSDIDVSHSSYDFGEVEVGSISSQIVTVTNAGIETCVFSVGLTPDSSSDFSITSDPSGLEVDPNATVDIEISFSPTSEGFSDALLEISSDIPNPTSYVHLSGNGVSVEDPLEEQITDILDFIDETVSDGSLVGSGNGNSAEKRLNAFINMIEAADDLITNDDYAAACDQLMSAYKKCDGLPRPPDFVEGGAADDLAQMISDLMAGLGCE
jgi:beta propeller repeat protein